MNEIPEFMTRSEVARLYRVCRETVIRWEKTGKIRPAGKSPSGRSLYASADLLKTFPPHMIGRAVRRDQE